MARRLPTGGYIDRRAPLRFTFDGRACTGYAGDTLASALLASGVRIVGRSFKLHRPRGIMSAGLEETNALVTVGEGGAREVNVRATEIPLRDGLVATSQNCWPSPQLDLRAAHGWFARFLPAGFYHKTFLWPGFSWYERAIRTAAGLGRIDGAPDPAHYAKRFHHCDVLVVGGGAAGIAAAQAAARGGADVTLLELRERLVGAAPAGVTVLTRTTALGVYDDGFVSAVQSLDAGPVAQRLWKIRAAQIELATGAIERPLVFDDNDRPGVMLAAAVREYAERYAVLPGERCVVYTNNDTAYATALALQACGGQVVAVIDRRPAPVGTVVERTRAAGIPVVAGAAVVRALGRTLHGVELADGLRLSCDLLAVSGGWNPNLALYAQAGGTLRWDEARACFVPDRCAQPVGCVGAAAGDFDAGGVEPAWLPPRGQPARQWVDFMHDVSVADLALAQREGFVSAEHAKRYTATGMAPDQGKTSSVNALAILGAQSGRAPAEVGTTTFRPPYHPVRIGALAGPRVGALAQRYRRLPVEWHERNGGVMEDHSGWLRAAAYPRPGESVEQAAVREARAARTQAALFDSSSLGKIEVLGKDAAEFLNRLYVNNVKTLQPGRLRYGMMLSDHGIIKDDGVFGCLAPGHYLVCTSSSGARDIHFWMEEWRQTEWPGLDVRIVPQTAQWATLTVSGPHARTIVARLGTGVDLEPAAFPHMHLREGRWQGAPLRIRRASFTGEASYELDVPADRAEALWAVLLEAGAPHGITPLGMEALDLLRVEKGFLEVGVDTDGETTPLDCGWGPAIAKKPEDFIGRRSLARPHQQRPDRLQLVGLRPEDPRLAVPVGTHAVDAHGAVLGHVTSSCLSPALERSVAMGRLRAGAALLGQAVLLDIGGRRHRAEVCDRAFYDPQGARLHA